ncbi:MAG: hypothetical protein R3F11_27645 [Verrucomicrobiales bacterium]
MHDEWYFNIRFPDPAPAAAHRRPEEGLIRRYIHWNPAGDSKRWAPAKRRCGASARRRRARHRPSPAGTLA